MSQSVTPPQKIAILGHPDISEALDVAGDVAEFWRATGGSAEVGSLFDPDLRQGVMTGAFDLVIALGGDGTMLRAGHLCAPAEIPLLGVNIGHFGFLVEVKRGSLAGSAETINQGRVPI